MIEHERSLRMMAEKDPVLAKREIARWAEDEIDRLRLEARRTQEEVCKAMLEELDRMRGELGELKIELKRLKKAPLIEDKVVEAMDGFCKAVEKVSVVTPNFPPISLEDESA